MNSYLVKKKSKNENYNKLIEGIGKILEKEKGRKQAFYAVNKILVKTYWEIGRHIVEFEQKGTIKADYGSKILDDLSRDLKMRYGKGFSRSNLVYVRLFYIKYPKSETVSHQLTWSHYFELLKVDGDMERSFYEKQCVKEKWCVRELKRQKESSLFHRIALSKDKEGVLELSRRGQILEKSEDIIKEPYVLEFLKILENYEYSEKELAQKIIDNLQMFFALTFNTVTLS